jgi:DnaJ family protein C protein 28
MPINVSEQIEEAMERGEFRNLPGKGKPLKLDTNPFLTPQARMANRLLKENGFAPRWIELEKEIKQEKAQLERLLTNLKARRERLATLIAQHPHRHETVSRSFEYELARGIAQYSEKLENLNQKIQRLNLLMPTRNRQYALINKEAALTRFQKACPSL